MKFSTRTTYGLRALTILAKNYGQGSVPLSAIAKQENISVKYLERLFASLKKENIIKSEKGKSGGYLLNKAPNKIKIFDIVKSLEGDIVPFHCINEKGEIKCLAKDRCGATDVLVKVQQAINKTLKNIKLSDLII